MLHMQVGVGRWIISLMIWKLAQEWQNCGFEFYSRHDVFICLHHADNIGTVTRSVVHILLFWNLSITCVIWIWGS